MNTIQNHHLPVIEWNQQGLRYLILKIVQEIFKSQWLLYFWIKYGTNSKIHD